ncbi:MAG: hypothetical protein J6C19_05710 [Lachnospiraceae bacterium]|nr:hypothetical protein [Lachnospiraceae bacterium]
MMVTIEPDEALFKELMERLDGKKEGNSSKASREAMKKAINEFAANTKNRLHSETRERYTIKARAFNKSDIKIENATARHLKAFLRVSGPTVGIYKYATRKNGKRKGASAMVLSSGSMEELKIDKDGKTYKAFLATMKTGHKGFFQRVPGEYARTKTNRPKIKEIMSLSEAKALEMVYRQQDAAEMQEQLYTCLHNHINAMLGGE